ncbi:MAG: helix-turn-helix domain-containing protein [Nakamurella multipartita]
MPTTSPDPRRAIAAAAVRDAGVADEELLGDFIATLAATVAAGERLPRAARRRCADSGRRAAVSGVPLRALLDLHLSVAWRLWRHVAPADDPQDPVQSVVRAGEVMLRAIDDAVAALTEGYQLARRQVVAEQAAARREFVDDLLLGGAQAAVGLAERAGEFGLNLAGPHAVVVVRAQRPFVESSPLTSMLERSLMGANADADALVTTKDDALVVVFAAPDRAAVDQVVSALTANLPAPEAEAGVRLHRVAAVGAWRMGVGRAHPGPAGVGQSYAEAIDALALGQRLGLPELVVDAADLLLYRVLVRDEAAMRELVDAVLAPLVGARGGAEPLLQTLDAYFGAGGNATLAARSLHLSVRALTYRLAKIADLTGRDPVDPRHRLELQTALVGARLLGMTGT